MNQEVESDVKLTYSVNLFLTDSVMIFIVLMARRYRLNPDNIVTPVAGAIGDILTLGILVGFSLLFYSAFRKLEKNPRKNSEKTTVIFL